MARTKKELISVAKELNEVLGLDPEIKTISRQTVSDLEVAIKQAISLIEAEDEFTEATQAIIDELNGSSTEIEDEEEETQEEETQEEEDEEEEDEEEEDEEDLDAPEGEEGAENSEEEPVLKQDKKKKEPPLGKKEKTAGVIMTIVELIEKAGQKGISKEQILEELIRRFPDRQPTSMKNTINVQVPTRISKERFPLEKTPDNKFRRKK